MDAVLNEAADGAGLRLDRVCDGGAGGVLGGLTQEPPPAAGESPRLRAPADGSMLARWSEESPGGAGCSAVLCCRASVSPVGSPNHASREQVVSEEVNTLTQSPRGSLSGGFDGPSDPSRPSGIRRADDGKPGILTQIPPPDSPGGTCSEPSILTQVPPAERPGSSRVVGKLSQLEPPANPSRVARQDATDSPQLSRKKASLDSRDLGGTSQTNSEPLARQKRASPQRNNVTLSSDASIRIYSTADVAGEALTIRTGPASTRSSNQQGCRRRQIQRSARLAGWSLYTSRVEGGKSWRLRRAFR